MKVRKKPIVVDAEQLSFENVQLIAWAIGKSLKCVEVNTKTKKVKIQIKTLEGVMTATNGDWIIKGTKGEFYPCKDEIFQEIYEAVK